MHGPPRSPQGHEDVDGEGEHGDEHAHRRDHGNGLEPLGDRGLQNVVGPHGRVEERERPEGDQRQRVAVERPLDLLGDDVVHERDRAGREPQTQDVMAVEPRPDSVVEPGERAGGRSPDDVADGIDDGEPDERAHDVPQADVQVLGRPRSDGAEEVVRGEQQHHHEGDVDRPGEFGIFARLCVAQEDAHEARGQRQVPENHDDVPQTLRVDVRLGQPRHDVVPARHHGHRQPPERKPVHVHLPDTREHQP